MNYPRKGTGTLAARVPVPVLALALLALMSMAGCAKPKHCVDVVYMHTNERGLILDQTELKGNIFRPGRFGFAGYVQIAGQGRCGEAERATLKSGLYSVHIPDGEGVWIFHEWGSGGAIFIVPERLSDAAYSRISGRQPSEFKRALQERSAEAARRASE